MFKINQLNFLLIVFSLFFMVACGDDDVLETCTDGIMNQDETGIDCGGACTDCFSCTDGIMNGTETGVDCGGDCDVCATCTDGIMNGNETGIDCGGDCPDCITFDEHITADINGVPFAANLVLGAQANGLISFQSDQSQERQLFFDLYESISEGTFDLSAAPLVAVEYKKLFEGEYENQSGSITVTNHDQTARELSGTFEFVAIQYSFGTPVDTITVTNGSFDVEY